MNRHPRILAVDDDPMNRIVIMEYLDEDYDLLTVESGEECLEVLSQFRPDLVLLDIMMPGLDGYEVCRRIRATPSSRHVKVILVSAKAMLEERLEGYEAGADDYVTKPFSGDELRAKLDVYLRLRSIEELDDLKGQFLALLSHETRTPLTAILSPAHLLEFELHDQPEHQEMVRLIIDGGLRLESMIGRALRLCEYKAERAILSPQRTDLQRLVEDVIAVANEEDASKQVEIEMQPADDAWVSADPDELRDAVAHVFQRLRDTLDDGALVDVRWSATAEHVEFTVSAEGRLFEEEWMPHLFEDFFVPALENHSGALALDLALAGAIVRAHSGMISAGLDDGRTAFSIRLPRRVDPARVNVTDAIPEAARNDVAPERLLTT